MSCHFLSSISCLMWCRLDCRWLYRRWIPYCLNYSFSWCRTFSTLVRIRMDQSVPLGSLYPFTSVWAQLYMPTSTNIIQPTFWKSNVLPLFRWKDRPFMDCTRSSPHGKLICLVMIGFACLVWKLRYMVERWSIPLLMHFPSLYMSWMQK